MLENKICLSQLELVKMFWYERTHTALQELIRHFSSKYSLQEIFLRSVDDATDVGIWLNKEITKAANKIVNYEICLAIDLSRLYFQDSVSQICFDLKPGIKPIDIKTYGDLDRGIEGNTAIDCTIKDDKKIFHFQLKRYPERYRTWDVQSVINFLTEDILPIEKYNNDANRDLNVVILLQPKLDSDFDVNKDLEALHNYLSNQTVKLREIDFVVNWNNEALLWHQVFPQLGHHKIPLYDVEINNGRAYWMGKDLGPVTL